MAKLPAHVSAYHDRHGRLRYRYREKGKPARALPGEPGNQQFEDALAEAKAGIAPPSRSAKIARPSRTLRAAWLEVQTSIDWKNLKFSTKTQQINIAERFLASPIAPGESTTFGQLPFEGLARGAIKRTLGRYSATPHAAGSVLRLLRKLCLMAVDNEWIEHDPTYRIKYRPKTIGHRAWTDDELVQYKRKWAIGTPQRLGYALALYTGQRRADVAAMTWKAFDGTGIAVRQQKTGTPLWIPVHPNLAPVLTATKRRSLPILVTSYGNAFTTCGFGNMMADAIGDAGLPDACRLHGLRKAAGRCLAEAGATANQIMAVLGHKTLAEAGRYTKEAAQKRLAQQGMDHWSRPQLAVVGGTDRNGS
jgi:integrase